MRGGACPRGVAVMAPCTAAALAGLRGSALRLRGGGGRWGGARPWRTGPALAGRCRGSDLLKGQGVLSCPGRASDSYMGVRPVGVGQGGSFLPRVRRISGLPRASHPPRPPARVREIPWVPRDSFFSGRPVSPWGAGECAPVAGGLENEWRRRWQLSHSRRQPCAIQAVHVHAFLEASSSLHHCSACRDRAHRSLPSHPLCWRLDSPAPGVGFSGAVEGPMRAGVGWGAARQACAAPVW